MKTIAMACGDAAIRWLKLANAMIKQKERNVLFAIFMLAIAIRVFIVFSLPTYTRTLDYENGHIARNILNGNGYSAGVGWVTPYGEPTAHKPPLYPLFLVGSFYFFPDEWNPIAPAGQYPEAHLLVQVIQSLISGFIVLVLYQLGKLAFNPLSGMLAAFLFSVNPNCLYQHRQIERMTFDMFLFVLLTLLFLRLAQKPSPRSAILGGLVAGLALLNNPSIALFIVFAQVWLLLRAHRSMHVIDCLKVQVIVLICTVLVLMPWIYRNYLVFHRFIPFSSNFGFELWVGNHPNASGGLYDSDLQFIVKVPQSLLSMTKEMNEPERYDYLGKVALGYMLADPKRMVELRFWSWIQFWFGEIHLKMFAKVGRALILIGNLIMILLAWVGLFVCIRARWGPNLLFLLLLLGVAFPYSITHGGDRYRDGLIPILNLYVANLFMYLCYRFRAGMNTTIHVSQTERWLSL